MSKTADILVANFRQGDATSAHGFDMARILMRSGWKVRIWSNGLIGPLPNDIRAITKQIHPGDYVPDADLTVVEYAVWFPLAERIRDAKHMTIFCYQGVTPPDLWGTEVESDILRRSQMGTELAWHAHLTMVASPFSARELQTHSHYPADRIRIVPLGIDVTSFHARPPAKVLETLRRQWGLQDKRVLLYTGRIAGNKRIDLLIDAMPALLRQYPDLHLLVVGDNSSAIAYRELSAALLAQSERLGISQHVTFTGRVGVIEPYYHLADVYVLPSQHECFGVPLVEAMATETPVVASASGSMPWILGAEDSVQQDTGLVFAPGQVDDLVLKITSLLDNADLRAKLIERGTQRVKHFSKQIFMENVTRFLEEAQSLALQGPPPAAQRTVPSLVRRADVALRNYRVRSNLPVLGRLIEKVRYHLTTHVKEAYVDRIVEQQVLYNRLVAEELLTLRAEVERLREEIEQLKST